MSYPSASRTQRASGHSQPAPYNYNPRPVNDPTPEDDPECDSGDGGDRGGHGGTAYPNPRPRTERTLQSHGGHYVMPPDPARNEKLRRTAQEEETDYERHRALGRERIAQQLSQQEPRTVGGPAHSREELEELRRKQEREQQLKAKYAAIHRKQKREEYMRAKREREDAEIEQRKQIQKEKARRLEAKQRAQTQIDQQDLRRKRLAHFEHQT